MKELEKKQISILREQYVIKYCKNLGWNPNELSTKQMLIVVNQQEYISPIFKHI
jgi:hypothetical protein